MAGDFVGVMDSGLGGISVLRELVRVLPHEEAISSAAWWTTGPRPW